MTRFAALLTWGLGTAVGFCTACDTTATSGSQPAPASRAASPETVRAAGNDSPHVVPVVPASVATVATVATPTVSGAPVAAPKQLAPAKGASSLSVKRFVVTTGVKDREPLTDSAQLVADGSIIFAFAELANPSGDSENVRITFERKGGAERVGNVTLPIPGQVPRHRTWATTRFIRSAGVWDAVLWNEAGAEIGRTSFEVGAAS
jgi:hypothetical protein